jgi:hypothetical protein
MPQDKRDRLNIDLQGLREQIEALQSKSRHLAEMKISQVVRYLLKRGIEAEEKDLGEGDRSRRKEK